MSEEAARAEVQRWSDKLAESDVNSPAFDKYAAQLQAARNTYDGLVASKAAPGNEFYFYLYSTWNEMYYL